MLNIYLGGGKVVFGYYGSVVEYIGEFRLGEGRKYLFYK